MTREFAADREGVKLAVEAGYSLQGAIRLLTMYVVMGAADDSHSE